MRTVIKVYIQVWLLTFMPWIFSCLINVTFLPDDFKVACLGEAKKSVSAYITGEILSVGEILFQIWVTSVLNTVKSLLSSLGLFWKASYLASVSVFTYADWCLRCRNALQAFIIIRECEQKILCANHIFLKWLKKTTKIFQVGEIQYLKIILAMTVFLINLEIFHLFLCWTPQSSSPLIPKTSVLFRERSPTWRMRRQPSPWPWPTGCGTTRISCRWRLASAWRWQPTGKGAALSTLKPCRLRAVAVSLSRQGAAPRVAKPGVQGQSGEGGRVPLRSQSGHPLALGVAAFCPLACPLRV